MFLKSTCSCDGAWGRPERRGQCGRAWVEERGERRRWWRCVVDSHSAGRTGRPSSRRFSTVSRNDDGGCCFQPPPCAMTFDHAPPPPPPLAAHALQLLVPCPSSGASSTTASCSPGALLGGHALPLYDGCPVPSGVRRSRPTQRAGWSRTPPPRNRSSRQPHSGGAQPSLLCTTIAPTPTHAAVPRPHRWRQSTRRCTAGRGRARVRLEHGLGRSRLANPILTPGVRMRSRALGQCCINRAFI